VTAQAGIPGRWTTGEDQIRSLLEQGKLQEVEASAEHAAMLVSQAETHLSTARLVLEHDPVGAYSMLYDAARKSMTAVLAQQGLRPTVRGGHRVVQDAIGAQLGQRRRGVVRRFRELRIQRHDTEYPEIDSSPVTPERAAEDLQTAESIVETMKVFLPQVGPWRRPAGS
jgi:HEPN domain-containing protein